MQTDKTSIEKTVIRTIGQFYLEKNSMNYIECHRELDMLQIRDVSVDNIIATSPSLVCKNSKRINITLERPGILIGKNGENIEALKKYLKENLSFDEFVINLKESSINTWLYPQDWVDNIDHL